MSQPNKVDGKVTMVSRRECRYVFLHEQIPRPQPGDNEGHLEDKGATKIAEE